MEIINTPELKDESIYPSDEVLRRILGNAFTNYIGLMDFFSKHDISYEWRYYKDGKAWLCKVQLKKRTIVWMSAWKGYMQATVYFPQKYIEGINETGVSKTTLDRINRTKNTGKSKPCIFKVDDSFSIDDFEKIVLYKIKSK